MLLAGVVILWLIALAGEATAQTWNGSASTDWTNAANWTGGVPTNSTVGIETTSPNRTVVGVGGASNATTGQLYVGRNNGGVGSLTIQNGSTLTGSNYARVGENGGSSGAVTVTGAGTSWMINNVTVPGLIVGNFGTGKLDITNGGSVVTDAIYVGRANTGVLNITGGGTLTTTGSTVPSILGRDAAGNAIVTVSGAGSAWTVGGAARLVVGSSGTAALNIQNGGDVIATNGIKVGDLAGSSGVINLSNGGKLETLDLDGTGAGAKQLNFDNGILRAKANNASFITGFAGDQLNLQSGGLTLDTQSFNVTAASPFSGDGGLTKTGTGTLTLTGANNYHGQTWIQSGTLALSGSGTIASSNRVIADGTFDISAVTPTSTDIQSLAGTGTVNLGAKTLTLKNANDTFAGSITGTGGLTVSAGTQTLTGANNYTGATVVNGTGTLQLVNGGQITSTAAITLDGANVTATVSGIGSLLQTGTLTIGNAAASNATLNILDGGVVRKTGTGGTIIGGGILATAIVNVDGLGSRFEVGDTLGVGSANAAANGFLNITNGAAVLSAGGTVGSTPPSTATKSVLVAGQGSSWTVNGVFNLQSAASVSILDGGAVNAMSSTIGKGAGGTANLLVSGTGATYSVAGNQDVGTNTATGTITLASNGVMSVGGQLTLASAATGTGVLNIGGAEGEAATGAGTLNAATLTFGSGTGRLNFNHTDANYIFSTVVSGAGTINHTGPGRTNFTSNGSGFAGSTFVSGGTLAVNGSLCGPMNVLAGGTLGGTGTVCDTTNAGVVAPGNSIGTLTVNGAYVGSGGTLEIESVLGDDTSATDRLVVTGNTSGATNVRVINVGGAGAQTTEGIKIVDVGGASNGTFSLLGDYVFQGDQAVVGGAYAYRLYKGSVSAPGDGDWYLRSTLDNALLFQAGDPLYEAYGSVLQQSFAALETLQQRVGNRAWSGGVVDEDGKVIQGLWGRIVADQAKVSPQSSTTSTSYDVSTSRFQIGADGVITRSSAGELVGGGYLEFGTTSASVASVFGSGAISSLGFGAGATLTYYGSGGFYVDAKAQLKDLSSTLSSSTAGLNLVEANGGFGYGFSLEAGQTVRLTDALSVTPQAQLAYSSVRFDDFTDAFGAHVSLRDAEQLVGRLGLSADYDGSWTDDAGHSGRTHLYGIANLYYDFTAGSEATIEGVSLATKTDPLRAGIGLGGSIDLMDGRLSLYGETSVNTGLSNPGKTYSIGASAGLRGQF